MIFLLVPHEQGENFRTLTSISALVIAFEQRAQMSVVVLTFSTKLGSSSKQTLHLSEEWIRF